ncbi:hypothetical protein H257_11187 [Aphanomyces astaci]|uniref:Uncharacterized protein n=1 Tax=Aphanomyces astaci TaxID=112090 RepID=W4G5P6_APHAT|nr:hypothetical protein H257_11187 [Aphanomyces astaci]ETV74253.1 hypothetical protein H257_11187 [Aphanomyces astaci]|eukprot:XP_009836359.1 hypothetical protein H257_11187 [Aphanomyces astaci]
MASLPPGPGKQQPTPPTLSDTTTTATPMATVIVHRNGIPTAILVLATGIIRQPHPSSSENDSASDTTKSPVDPPLTARQLRWKHAADTFLARHDRKRTKRAANRPRHTHTRPTRPGTTSPTPEVTQLPQPAAPLSDDDRPIHPRSTRTPHTATPPRKATPLKTSPTTPSAPTHTPSHHFKPAKGSSTQSSLPDIWRQPQHNALAPPPITSPYTNAPIPAPITAQHGTP